MASKLKEIEKEIYLLPEHDRAVLAKNLILSLENNDQEDADDAEIERLWIEEAQQRLKEFEKDETIGRPAEDVLKELRSKYS